MGVALAATPLAVLTASPAHAAPVEIQILATNDFHGRLQENAFGGEAGAAVLSGAVKQLRAENPNTVFAAAGDLIGASTFESFIQQDKPTIDALNEADLEVSAVGNHEFDQGYDDLINRVMAPYDADTNPYGGAEWEYIGANVRLKATGDPAVPATWIKEMAGVEVGFVGTVTEDLPSLVSPSGIADIEVTDIVDETNTYADELKAEGADVVVMLVHEGSPTTDCDTMDDSGAWADVINGVNDNVDAIVSGHTHLAYDCDFPVAGWTGRTRPVVSAGQYGQNLNQLVFTVDDATGEVENVDQALLPLLGNYPADPAVETIVADAVAEADELGAAPLGEIAGPFQRARLGNGNENRGGESTLGNLVAEVQRDSTEAEIAFMNPGGLRQDMVGLNEGGYPATLTYKQAAEVQPFANTLVKMGLTGAQIKTVLEQQWQRDDEGEVPSRPFLRLGTSAGFEYSYDPTRAEGDRVTGIWLDGEPLSDATTYSVTVNSFLASGGDNFHEFDNGADPTDTGQIDLQAMVEYMDQFDAENPLDVDYAQHSVGATVTEDNIELTSLAMTGPNDVHDTEVEVFDGETSLGTFEVDTTVGTVPFDEAGTVTVPNTIPNDGELHMLRVVGESTGTDIVVPAVAAPKSVPTLTVTTKPKKVIVDKTKAKVVALVEVGGEPATGRIEVEAGGTTYEARLQNGRAFVKLERFNKTGMENVKVTYLGNATTEEAVETVTIEVVRK
jgi:5'-nucleotidase